MKLTLKLTFAVLGVIAGVYGSSSEEDSSEMLSSKEKIRLALIKWVNSRMQPDEIQLYCRQTLSPEDLASSKKSLNDFITCGNATIDIFTAKLDDDVSIKDINDIRSSIRRFTQPVCEVFDDIFRCIGELEPLIDLCIYEDEKVLKKKLYAIVPLIHQTLCLRNGALFADIVEHEDGLTCIERTFTSVVGFGFMQQFVSESDEIFGDEPVCQRLSAVLQMIYEIVGECSPSLLGLIKEMFGFFCEGTRCERFINDIQCY